MNLRRNRLATLAGLALLIAVTWAFLGVFVASKEHANAEARGHPESPHERARQTLATCVVWALLTPLVIYIADRLPVRSPRRLRNILWLITVGVLVAWVRSYVDASIIPEVLKKEPLSRNEFRGTVVAVLHQHFLFFAVIVGFTNFVRERAEADERARRATRIDAELVQAQLRRLRSDLQPHFLFNTLNAVTTLVHTDARAAEETIAKLIELLRTSLDANSRTEVLLAEELDFVGRYLDLQKLRFGDRLRSAIEVADPRLLRARVPPLLLQPLVENSIIHGIRKQPDGGEVTVRAYRDGHDLRIEVRDSGPGCDPEAPFSSRSIGVPNTRARLEFLYHDARALCFRREGGQFVAHVRIPLRFT